MQCAGPLPLDEEQLARHLQGNGGEEPERINFKAIDTDTCEMMVHIEWNRIDWNNGSTTLSRVLPAEVKGWERRWFREAVRYTFDPLHLHLLDLYVFDFNHSAIGAYERGGFRQEGTLREAWKRGDTYWRLCVMSLLDREWRGSR